MEPRLATADAIALCAALPAWADCSMVRMAEPGWTDLALTSAVTQGLLEGMGHQTRVDIQGIPLIYESMKRGDLDAFMGYWDPAMETYFNAYRDSGAIETIHVNLEGAKFTWAVPAYVHEAGVTSFADLAAHADRFERTLYGIEPGSNEIMLDIVARNVFGLGDWEVRESSKQGMLAQLAREERRGNWMVFLAWAPHPMNTNFEIRYLEGGDDYYGPDFGGTTVSTLVRKGYVEECPQVGKLLNQLTFDVALASEGMGYILDEDLSPRDAARRLIARHPERLEGWLSGVRTTDGAAALPAVKADLGL